MNADRREVLGRKLATLDQYISDLEEYASFDERGRRKAHYAIERLLQLLCEAAADIGLQLLKMENYGLASSYRDIFRALRDYAGLSDTQAERLMDACAMRNVLTHLYDTIDLDRVVAAVDPAIALYSDYADWARGRLG